MAKGKFGKAVSRMIKSLWRRSGKELSLKQFVRTLVRPEALAWQTNKKVNAKNPPKKIGNTRKKSGAQAKKPAAK